MPLNETDVVRTSRVGVEGKYYQAKVMHFRNPLSFHVVVDISNLSKVRGLIKLYADTLEVVRNPYEGNERLLWDDFSFFFIHFSLGWDGSLVVVSCFYSINFCFDTLSVFVCIFRNDLSPESSRYVCSGEGYQDCGCRRWYGSNIRRVCVGLRKNFDR